MKFEGPNHLITRDDIDGVVGEEAFAAVDADPNSLFRLQQDARLESRIVTALAEDETVVNAAAIATGFGWLKVSETPPSRTAGVTTTNASTAITAVAGTFSADDVGAPISGTGIPAGATITAVTSDTEATLSGAATATGTVTATIGIIKVSGLDVVWIDKSEQLTPIPVNPPPPTWNDNTSSFTIPSNVIGVDYVWTSGGGGVGETLTPGATLATSGAFPRRVTITATPQPGYVAFAGGVMVHDFGNPATITTLTSDSFTGAVDTDVIGTWTDAALGGSPSRYSHPDVSTTFTPIDANGFHRDGSKLVHGTSSLSRSLWFPASPNAEVSFNLTSLATAGSGYFGLFIGRPTTPGSAFYSGITLTLQTGRLRIQCSTTDSSPDLHSGLGVEPPLGNWTVRLVGTTLTVIDGSSTTRVYDLSDPSWFLGQPDLGVKVRITNIYAAGTSWSIDDLVVKKIGA